MVCSLLKDANREGVITAYNVVRFRTKPGLEDEFEDWFCKLRRDFEGLRKMALIKTGDRSYCSIGEWESYDHIIAARPKMISNLDKFRHSLEVQGESIDVTDAVSGEAIYESTPTR
ncbi:antibiotic biosynthesis monooxygenase [Ensifer psoraleae]|uniref:Antibiotic biosynthesis monooxygenase n=2 Tax=Sinorhizobium psoraleae TaxID=520838 RepID=A0ABT4KKU9_9HYPH|nr:antibiotic biosynthesis monooxygenase [Sinorhizobium psoraleae]MCZ4092603.1 antibiotic biosynthesis monooxygenase [Sinorhizobium psoraleae]